MAGHGGIGVSRPAMGEVVSRGAAHITHHGQLNSPQLPSGLLSSFSS